MTSTVLVYRYAFSITFHSVLRMKIFQTNVVQKIKIHILGSVTPPPPKKKNRSVCEIMWKNMEERGRKQMAI